MNITQYAVCYTIMLLKQITPGLSAGKIILDLEAKASVDKSEWAAGQHATVEQWVATHLIDQ